MMNRSSSAEAYVPSMMSFVGLEGSSQKQHPWDWETTPHNPNTAIPSAVPAAVALPNHPFFTSSPFLDCPPPLLPMNSYPYYSSPLLPEYPVAADLVKREDGGVSGVGGGRIGLNLGHRTYFSSGDALTIDRLFARSRGVYSLSHQPPRCQAEGCKADLSGAKHYHRRHKVCEFHSKATVVIAGGLQQRFCQQCSRFHVLSEFDEAKRSCRKRLADHNRRRRKPQLPAASSDSSTPKNPTNNSMDKSKQAPKTTRDIPTSKSTASISCANSSLEGQQGYQNNNPTPLRNGPALSLGGVGTVEKGGLGSHSQPMYQHQGPFVAMAEEKASQQHHQQQPFSSPSSTNSTYFHHHNLFSSSNEASQSTGGASDHTTHDLLHLRQAMFEVDFM